MLSLLIASNGNMTDWGLTQPIQICRIPKDGIDSLRNENQVSGTKSIKNVGQTTHQP